MSTSLHLQPELRYTWADFIALADDDRRELVDGRLLEIEVPTKHHEWMVANVITDLGTWVRKHGGLVLGSGYKVRIREDRGVMPDVQLYRKGSPRGAELGLSTGAPDLVVEVLSPSSRRFDRVTKLGWYRDIGTPEYWLVDPESRSIERLVLDGDTWRLVDAVGEGTFEPDSFPGLSIDLEQLFTLPE